MKMTVDEMNRVDELHDDLDDALEGEEFSVCLHALCATIAGAGVNVSRMPVDRRASKQLFMASVHEAISSWYDHYDEVINGESE
jgi:hypothetical protein